MYARDTPAVHVDNHACEQYMPNSLCHMLTLWHPPPTAVGRQARLPRDRAAVLTAAPPLVPAKLGLGKDTSRLQFKSVLSDEKH